MDPRRFRNTILWPGPQQSFGPVDIEERVLAVVLVRRAAYGPLRKA